MRNPKLAHILVCLVLVTGYRKRFAQPMHIIKEHKLLFLLCR